MSMLPSVDFSLIWRNGICLVFQELEKDSFLFYSVLVFFCLFFVFFRDRFSLYSPGCPETHFVDQAGLEFRNLPASASRVLGLKVCATTRGKEAMFF